MAGLSLSDKSYTIFFKENEHELSQKQTEGLTAFLNKSKKTKVSLSIIGYADACGSKSHNLQLSKKRANSAYLIARRHMKAEVIRQSGLGERGAHHHGFERRVDIIAHTSNLFVTSIEKMPSDFYLIDASGSMWRQHKVWSDIISASLKPKSRIFLSITTGCRNGLYINEVSPQGGTEIWWSYWNLIDKMIPGETLLIVSDFQSTVPLSAKERVRFEKKVRASKVIVRSASP